MASPEHVSFSDLGEMNREKTWEGHWQVRKRGLETFAVRAASGPPIWTLPFCLILNEPVGEPRYCYPNNPPPSGSFYTRFILLEPGIRDCVSQWES